MKLSTIIRQNFLGFLSALLSGFAAGFSILILTLLYSMKSDVATLQSYVKVDEAMHAETKTELKEFDGRLQEIEVWKMFMERSASGDKPIKNEFADNYKMVFFRPEEKYTFKIN